MTTAILFLALAVTFGSFIIADGLWKIAEELRKDRKERSK